MYQFKGKDSEIKDHPLCLGNISKDFTIGNMKRKNSIKKKWNVFIILILLMLTIF